MNRKAPLARKTPLVSKKGLTRSGALARRVPMPKATSELRRRVAVKKRNAKRRDPAKATAQRHAVMERAQGRCEMEIRVGSSWRRCIAGGELFTAHVVRRHLCGEAIYEPDVAVASCLRCHDVADHRTAPATWDSVRFPEGALERAMTAIRRAEQSRADRGLAVVAIPSPAALCADERT